MTESYTGVSVLEVSKDIIDQLYREKEVEIWDITRTYSQNEYLVIKDITGASGSVLGRVKGDRIFLLPNGVTANGLKPKNKEQVFALDALLDPTVDCTILTGAAGVGKSLLAMAAALQLVDQGKYSKIIVSKNMVQTGRGELGFLPGDLLEKFMPFNQGVLCNLEYLVGGNKKAVTDLIEQYRIEFVPMAIVRGSSWHNAVIITDECQNMNELEILTLGTRVCAGSKLMMLADFNQIDTKMKRSSCGLYKFINHEKVKESRMVSSINLIKSERGELSTLFSQVFGEEV